MEFLKDLFGEQALTYDQLSKAVKEKGFQVVNAAGGAFVSKADSDNLSSQVTTLTAQLGEANKKLEGYDPTWKEKAETERKKLESQQFDFALEKAIGAAKPRNAKAVMALLDREKLNFAGGEVIGLDKQLDGLKKGEDTAFLFAEDRPMRTGLSHQGAHEVGGDDKKEAANEAFRSIFGRAE